jgi:PiT family inorganic phosphate transporter
MGVAWLITLPAAGLVGAACYFIGNGIGGLAGVLVVLGFMVALSGWMMARAHATAVNSHNVNDEWHADATPSSSVQAGLAESTSKS